VRAFEFYQGAPALIDALWRGVTVQVVEKGDYRNLEESSL
jgi:hypothetical protein